MKVSVETANSKQKDIITYPALYKSSYSGNLWLVLGKTEGVVLKIGSNNNIWCVGDYGDRVLFSEDNGYFLPQGEKVVLENN